MKRRFCFTLVEILVVTALVALLGAVGFAGYGYAMGAARRSATESLIKQIEAALENFKIKKGYYPSSSSYMAVAFTVTGGAITDVSFGGTALGTDASNIFIKPLDQEKLKKNLDGDVRVNGTYNLVDSWGGQIRYRYPGLVNTTGFDLIAPGPDGQFGVTPAADPADPPSAATYKNGTDWACDDIANFMDK